MKFDVTITVGLKEGMLDPEAQTIKNAIKNLGYETESLKTARLFRVRLDAANKAAARKMAEKMCERLLANPIIHKFEIEVS
ncbi:MAG: phosphoribosylformylglycinamidine synthase subunit PurS [Methanoregulaceae archaeon]|jgi:phosphoribosylformylglycinamidine synthase